MNQKQQIVWIKRLLLNKQQLLCLWIIQTKINDDIENKEIFMETRIVKIGKLKHDWKYDSNTKEENYRIIFKFIAIESKFDDDSVNVCH